MRILLLLSLVLFVLNAEASGWEYRVSDSLNSLQIQEWRPLHNGKNPLAREFEGYVEYRTNINAEHLMNNQGLYLGKIGDADKAFLNSHQIGQTGNFPPHYSYNMDTERVYFVPKEIIKPGPNKLIIQVYSKFLVNKGFSPSNFKIAPVAEADSDKYSNELLNNLSKIIIPILCLVLAAVSFPLLAPKQLWNNQVMIFLVSISSFILGICRGRLAYHYFDMLTVYKFTLVSSVLTIWLVTVLMTKNCKHFLKFMPSAVGGCLITAIIVSTTLVEAASWGRVWFHVSPLFLIFALYGVIKSQPMGYFRLFGLAILLMTNINDNLNDLRILSTFSLLQFGLGTFISCMIADQIFGLKKSWERYFMKEAQLDIDAKLGRQAIQIAHDLRSPIETIQSGINGQNFNPEIEHSLRLGLKRMYEICEALLSPNKPNRSKHNGIEIESALNEVKEELLSYRKDNRMLQNLHIVSQHLVNEVHFELNLSHLKRTFCNLVTNALEACNPGGEVKIDLKFNSDGLLLHISDNGVGIPESMDHLFERGFTTKTSGNGLGLCAAKDTIESLGGSIQLERLSQGTLVSIFIPSIIQEQLNTKQAADLVLIDDDPLVRFNWKRQGRFSSRTVHTFEKFEEFFSEALLYSKSTPIYIDSYLGGQKGEDLSEKLVQLGFTTVILTTGSPESSIINKRWISNIVGKGFDDAVVNARTT